MFRFLTPSSVIIILAGVVLILIGGWYGYRYRSYVFGGGLFFLGVGNMVCGFANSFTAFSPARLCICAPVCCPMWPEVC